MKAHESFVCCDGEHDTLGRSTYIWISCMRQWTSLSRTPNKRHKKADSISISATECREHEKLCNIVPASPIHYWNLSFRPRFVIKYYFLLPIFCSTFMSLLFMFSWLRNANQCSMNIGARNEKKKFFNVFSLFTAPVLDVRFLWREQSDMTRKEGFYRRNFRNLLLRLLLCNFRASLWATEMELFAMLNDH